MLLAACSLSIRSLLFPSCFAFRVHALYSRANCRFVTNFCLLASPVHRLQPLALEVETIAAAAANRRSRRSSSLKSTLSATRATSLFDSSCFADRCGFACEVVRRAQFKLFSRAFSRFAVAPSIMINSELSNSHLPNSEGRNSQTREKGLKTRANTQQSQISLAPKITTAI